MQETFSGGTAVARVLRPLLLIVLVFLATPVLASAATTSAHITNCPGASGCFTPDPIRITAGDSVTWTNNTSITHTATSDSGAWNTGNISAGSTSGAILFSTPGTFPYHCTIHPSMTGSVIVSAIAATPRPTVPPVRGLATGGGGPLLPGALVLLLGLALVAAAGWLRYGSKRP
jgi:plastocyanin